MGKSLDVCEEVPDESSSSSDEDPTSSLSGVKVKAEDGRSGSGVKKKKDEGGGSRTGVKAEDASSASASASVHHQSGIGDEEEAGESAGDEEKEEEEGFWNRCWWWQPAPQNVVMQGVKRMKVDGLKEAFKPDIHLTKRVLWIITIALCFGGGTYYTIDSANEYTMHSTEHSKHNPTSTRDALFGSFTYCPQYQFQASQIDKALRLLKIAEDEGIVTFNGETWTYEEIKMLIKFIHHSCEAAITAFSLAGYPFKYEFHVNTHKKLKRITFDPILDDITDLFITQKVIPFVQEGLVDCSKIALICFWEGRKESCTDLLRPVQTDVGTCCSFNIIPDEILRKGTSLRSILHQYGSPKNPEENNAWKKYNIDKDPSLSNDNEKKMYEPNTFPKRQRIAGRQFGLTLFIQMDKEPQACPILSSKGGLVAIQNPMNEPQMLRNGFIVRPNYETVISITAKRVTATEKMQEMKLHERKCYKQDESVLKMYSKYTQTNCERECTAMTIWNECECLPLALSGGKNETICGPENDECVAEANGILMKKGYSYACPTLKCYEACNFISYETQISRAPLEKDENFYNLKSDHNVTDDKDLAIIHAYQSQESVETSVGKRKYDTIDIIVFVFGIFGFATGLTLMTMFHMLEGVFYILLYFLLSIPCFRRGYVACCGPFSGRRLSTAKSNRKEKQEAHECNCPFCDDQNLREIVIGNDNPQQVEDEDAESQHSAKQSATQKRSKYGSQRQAPVLPHNCNCSRCTLNQNENIITVEPRTESHEGLLQESKEELARRRSSAKPFSRRASAASQNSAATKELKARELIAFTMSGKNRCRLASGKRPKTCPAAIRSRLEASRPSTSSSISLPPESIPLGVKKPYPFDFQTRVEFLRSRSNSESSGEIHEEIEMVEPTFDVEQKQIYEDMQVRRPTTTVSLPLTYRGNEMEDDDSEDSYRPRTAL